MLTTPKGTLVSNIPTSGTKQVRANSAPPSKVNIQMPTVKPPRK